MATQWTPQQQQAIQARNHTILVSAAAGSGKTAVLVERIVTLLREGFRLNRMLIVTFTRAAAAEMRQRLNQRLLKEWHNDPDLMGQALDDLECTEIATIHAFCQKVLRNSFEAVGIDPLSRVAETRQTEALFEQAFKDAMNELLEEAEHPDFLAFTESFNQREIHDITQQLYTFLMSLPHPFDWLEEKVSQVMTSDAWEQQPWYQVLVEQARRQLEGIPVLLSCQHDMFDRPNAVEQLRVTWEQDAQACRTLMSLAVQGTQALREAVSTFELVRAATCRKLTPEQKQWQMEFKALRDDIKALVKDTDAMLRLDTDRLNREFTVIQQHLKGLTVLVRRVHLRFSESKQAMSYLDFSDLEQMTMEVLSKPDYQQALQADYDHIFVDECQDVSAVQDAILQSIHGDNSCMFMVGDVKQSIYRFRRAEPLLFLNRMLTYSDDPNAAERRIFLQKNFRSRTAVLDATNMVFRKLMHRNVMELDYTASEELIPGRCTEDDPPVELHLIQTGADTAADEIAAEVQVIAERIRKLIVTPFDDNGQMRPYQYRDMVILMPKVAGVGSAMAQLLEEQGVPVYFDGAENYFNLAEITAMTALLQVLDNPRQDVALMAVLKQTPFHLTDGDLADIRLCKVGRDIPFHEAFDACREGDTPLSATCRASHETLAKWRFMGEVMRLPDFLWYLVRETGLYASCGALPEGELRQANLRMLCQRAAEFEENGGYTLSGFLQQLAEQKSSGDDRSAKMLGEGENLVRIMTIHKSKGLEFPVVFCARMNSKLHLPRRGGLLTHSRLGVTLPYVNRKLNIRRATVMDRAFDIQRLMEEKAERARLLYVAMTRARERLIMVSHVSSVDRPVWRLPESDYRILMAENMMDWVMQAVSTDGYSPLSTSCPQVANPCTIKVWEHIDQQIVDKVEVIHNMHRWMERVLSTGAVDELGIIWQELYTQRTAAPLKTSVTSLARKAALNDPLPLSDADEDSESKRQPETIVMPLRLSELPPKPAFMQERQLTGAERGTLMHRALSLMNLDALRQAEKLPVAIRAQVDGMVQQGCFTEEEGQLINIGSMVRFYLSELGQRLLHSENVRSEWSFNYLMDEAGTLLQGVIDCAFVEDGCWTLLDYKTDRIFDEDAFVERYTMQLNWYARAIEAITGREVRDMWLYALNMNQAYPVERRL
ncbi:MAG: helicase-exonuclease AddAB subunit AddA [Aristaeellaceae bacterium]